MVIVQVALVTTPAQSQQHAVGFTSLVVLDSSRSWERPVASSVSSSEAMWSPRPVRVSVWYPAQRGTGTALRMGDYLVHIRAGDSETTRRLDLRDRATFIAQVLDADATLFPSAASMAVIARRGAIPVGRAPLVLYSAGLNSLDTDNAFLAESLAARGFIVATVAQEGMSADRLDLSVGPADVETQVRDLEVALSVLRRRPNVDGTRVGVIGWSMGAVAALLFQMRHAEVQAVAALDPSFNYRNHPSRISASPWFAAERATTPVLVLEQHSADVTDAIVDSLSFAERDVVRYPGVVHEDFGVGAELSARLGTRWPRRSSGHALLVYRDAVSRVISFMDAQLRGRRESVSRFPAIELPAGSIVERHLPAAPSFISAGQLALQVERHGFAAAHDLLRARTATVREAEVNSLAYDLLRGPSRKVAVALFRLNAEVFSSSANAFDSLADGMLAVGDRAAAAEAYRRVLALVDIDSSLTPGTRETLRANATRFLAQFNQPR